MLVKINKTKAKKLYEMGIPIILVGNKVHPFHFFGGWHLAYETKPNQYLEESFEALHNEFYFYLDPELGNRVAFYVRSRYLK
jgi:hypothetical protein